MELEEFKSVWVKQKAAFYSQEELDSIFDIKQQHALAGFKLGLKWDLVIAVLISLIVIAILQMQNLATSNFWSVCMGILAAQHILFYQLQVRLIKRFSAFKNNIQESLNIAISKLYGLLWFYRLWPAILSLCLYTIYVASFVSTWPLGQIILVGAIIAITVAIISDRISAILVRKHYLKLCNLKEAFEQLSV